MFRNRNVSMSMPGTDPFTTGQHIDALSQRNKGEFLERMNAAAPVVEELADVRPSTWGQMKGLFTSMEAVGRYSMVGSLVSGLAQGAMRPMNILSGRIGFLFERLTMPMLPYINQITNDYNRFLMDNAIGGTIGSLAGMAIGSYYGGPIGGMIGSTILGGVGAFLESIWDNALVPGPGPSTPTDPLGLTGGGGSLPTGDIVDIGEDFPIRNRPGGGHTIIPTVPTTTSIIRRPRPNRRI